MKDATLKKLLAVKWNLVLMAVFCFCLAVYTFITPETGGEGMFYVTPRDGLTGILNLIPWCFIVFGGLGFIASFASKASWVLGWTEPLLGAGMFVWGFWELIFPFDISEFGTTFGFVGIFLAFYLMFVALDMDAKKTGKWLAELVLAAVVWIVSFWGLMNLSGRAGAVDVACLALFLAGWGFVYGVAILSGVMEPAPCGKPFWMKAKEAKKLKAAA